MTDAPETHAVTLAAWLSPAFPVGAFAYSHGLETAVASGGAASGPSVETWIGDVLAHGAGRSDAILIAGVMTGAAPDDDIAALAFALAPSAERALEAEAQGAAFAETVAAAWGGAPSPPAPYPVAFGRAAAAIGAPPALAITLYLTAFAANLVSAAIRLVPLGQAEGQGIVARLHPRCAALAAEAIASVEAAGLQDIGGAAVLADIASMAHEELGARLFRS